MIYAKLGREQTNSSPKYTHFVSSRVVLSRQKLNSVFMIMQSNGNNNVLRP